MWPATGFGSNGASARRSRRPSIGGAVLLLQTAERLERIGHEVDALADRRERHAERGVLAVIPGRPEPQDQASARHVIDGGRLLGEDRDRPVRDPGHICADLDAGDVARKRAEQRPRLEGRAFLTVPVGQEVIGHEGHVEADPLGAPPQVEDLVPAAPHRRRDDAEPDGVAALTNIAGHAGSLNLP